VNYTVQMIAFSLSAFVLNLLLDRAGLVPRWLSVWGLLGAASYLAVGVLVMYGLEPFSTVMVVMVVLWPCRRWCSRYG
jgi:hypothetical protein